MRLVFPSEKKILLIFALIYILLFLAFYPPFYRTPDEHHYIRGAYLLRQGILEIADPLHAYGFVSNGTGFVSFYPPLQSILLIPFTFLPWQGIFLAGLVLHLLNFFIFCKILKRLNYNPLFSLLFLFLPVLIFESRSLFAEMSSLTMLLLAFYFYLGGERKSGVLSGLFFGLAVASRYVNVFALIAVGIVLLLKNRKKLFYIAAGVLPIAVLLMLYQHISYGSPFVTGYSLINAFTFDLSLLPFRALYFALMFSIIYPLMFFSIFFSKNRLRNESLVSIAFFFLFWGTYWFSGIKLEIEDLIMAVNKFVPIIFLFLVAYIGVLHSLARKHGLERHIPKALVAFAILMLIPAVVVHSEHLERQEIKHETFKQIYSETSEGSLIVVDEQFHGLQDDTVPLFTAMYFMEPFGERKLISIKYPGYEQYIEDPGSTYYMKSYFEGSYLRVTIIKWNDFLKLSGQ